MHVKAFTLNQIMAQRKPYNPNTKYGRKKMREEHVQWKASLPPEERRAMEFNSCLLTGLVILIILIIIYAVGGESAVKNALRK